jgi:hypothetical protein
VKSDATYDVYFLIDPFTSEVFYVGIAEDYTQRYLQHLQMRDDNAQKNARIAAIKDHGSLPIVYRVMSAEGCKNALEHEAMFIELLLLCNQPLTNQSMKINTRSDQYMKMRNCWLETFKRINIHKGAPFPIPFWFVPQQVCKRAGVSQDEQNKQRKEQEETIQKIADEHNYRITWGEEYTDIYGTRRGFRAEPPSKKDENKEQTTSLEIGLESPI